MSKKISAYKVKNLSKVNTTLYKEGDHFITDRSVGILVNGKLKTVGNDSPDLSEYVKREEVKQMIDDAIKTGGE